MSSKPHRWVWTFKLRGRSTLVFLLANDNLVTRFTTGVIPGLSSKQDLSLHPRQVGACGTESGARLGNGDAQERVRRQNWSPTGIG